ncbi:hypothetical protein VP01_2117g2 [Puccinia sorghi]|uniref:Uncharacterized protein n=1 Tax=Puccinia sorghi TaxID=27349 RepID=A0A0L6V9X6_9BASI|nr:hypothetical protein VP01_2117g2 [Puccinia sorghi]
MEDVGICMEEDILTYDLLRRLPASLDNIKKSITHSQNGDQIKRKALLDHLEIPLNKLKVSSASKAEATTMFTKEDPQCIPGKHNPYSESHTKERFLKKDEPFLSWNYHNNLPVVKLEKVLHQSNLSVAKKLHKSLGHVSYSRIRNQ